MNARLTRTERESMELWTHAELRKIVRLPKFQRDVDIQHMNSIYSSLTEQVSRGINPFLPGCLIVAEITEPSSAAKEYMLLDGNHRFSAIERLVSERPDAEMRFFVNVLKCQSREEAEDLFRKVNNSMPMPEIPESVSMQDVMPVLRHFKTRYPKIFSNSRGGECRRPQLHERSFSEQVGKLLAAGVSSEALISGLEEMNRGLAVRHPATFKTRSADSVPKMQELMDRCMEKGGCYLGMVCLNDDYTEVFSYFGINDTSKKLKRVTNLTRPQREAIWDRHFPGQRFGRCYTCQGEIDIGNFHCAHDIPFERILREKGTGIEEDIGNIYPCCAGCNLSMGTTELKRMCVTRI